MGFFDFFKKIGNGIWGGLKSAGRGIWHVIKKGANVVGNAVGAVRDGVKGAINTITNIPVLGQAIKSLAHIPIPVLGGLSINSVLQTADRGCSIVKDVQDLINGHPNPDFVKDVMNLTTGALESKYPGLANGAGYAAVKEIVHRGVKALGK